LNLSSILSPVTGIAYAYMPVILPVYRRISTPFS
jgi:hypothetical protein